MKKSISVILSLVLLVSSLVIPMTVSANSGGLTPEAAYQAVVAAVDGLKLNLENVSPIELANPVSSCTSHNNFDYDHISITSVENSEPKTLGSQKVKINSNNLVTEGINKDWSCLVDGALHALKYEMVSSLPNYSVYIRDIGYIVVYVKTNRSFEMSLGLHNSTNATASIYATENNFIQVNATGDTYEPVVIDLSNVDWVDGTDVFYYWDNKKQYANNLYATDATALGGFYPNIYRMTEGSEEITDADNITFGSLFYVPVDENVRNFKFVWDSSNNTVNNKFESLTAEMIAAAEAIDNKHGTYTDESFAALQTAIDNAKATFIENGGDAVKLFKAEVANLYKLEEVFRPKFVETGSDEIKKPSDPADLSTLGLTDYRKASFGEYSAVVSSANNIVHFVDKDAPNRYEGSASWIYNNYKNLYLAVYNTGNTLSITETMSANVIDDPLYFSNNTNYKLLTLYNGYNLINFYDTYIEDWDLNVNNKTLSEYLSEHIDRTVANRLPLTLTIPDDTYLYFGSLMGERKFDTLDLSVVTDTATAISYYKNYIADKGYNNADDIAKTLSAMGMISIPVTGLYHPEDIEFTGTYDFKTALTGAEVSFRVNNVPTGVTVTVKYGEVKEPVGDVYKITAEAGQTLEINLSHVTTEFSHSEAATYYSDTNNLAKGLTPYGFVTDVTNQTRENRPSSAKFSDGNIDECSDIYSDVIFRKESSEGTGTHDGDYLNGYVPNEDFNFERKASQYDAYADVIYDLGCTSEINKVQHFTGEVALSMGVYQIYASTDIETLFNAESLVLNYQNQTSKDGGTIKSCQQHEFADRSARYVAFRIYCPVTKTDGAGYWFYNTLRINELAIYGTKTDDSVGYTVSTTGLVDWFPEETVKTPEGTVSLLKTDKLTVTGSENDVPKSDFTISDINKLNDTNYGGDVHADIQGYDFSNAGVLKNGYNIDRSDFLGNITFTQTGDITIYIDFKYELDDYYKVSQFELYSYCADYTNPYKTQAYQVYIGNDSDNRFTDQNKVVEYENYFNTSDQIIKFEDSATNVTGKYLGVRMLMPATAVEGNFPRIAEIAAFGNKVDAPTNDDLKPAELSARSVFVYDYNGSSVYKDSNNTEYTALRLSVGYSSPDKGDGTVDAGKIVLKDNSVANVIERNVIVMSKAKYDKLGGNKFDINTSAARYSAVQGDKLDQYFRADAYDDGDDDPNNNKPVDAAAFKVYGTYKFTNITEGLTGNEIVVLGRVVYEQNGKYYSVYTDVAGIDAGKTISPKSAYDALTKQPGKDKQGWFKSANAN